MLPKSVYLVALIQLLSAVLSHASAASEYAPRRILFAKCEDADDMTVKPKSVFMTCANRKGICEVRAGSAHTLRAVFVPTFNSSDVDSNVRWNSWIAIPLPGQKRDACDGFLECPVVAHKVTRFTYDLEIQNFWPRDEFPVIWSLTDRETNDELACWRFKIGIV